MIEKEGPIHISNVMLVDPRDNKPTRIRIERTEEGRRERVSVLSGHEADGEQLMAARLKERYESEIKPQLIERFGYSSEMQAPRIMKITAQHGRRRGQAGHQDAGHRRGAARHDRRAEAGDPPGEEVDRELQAARGHAGRREGRRCAATACGRCSTACSPSRSRGSGTSAASTRGRSTVAATTRSACASRSSFPRSTTTRSTRSAGWTSRSRPRPRPTTRRSSCCACWACHSAPRTRVRTAAEMRQQAAGGRREAGGRAAGRRRSSRQSAARRMQEEETAGEESPAEAPAGEAAENEQETDGKDVTESPPAARKQVQDP